MLTSAVERIVTDPVARKAITDYLAFKNEHCDSKEMSRPLKARSASIGGWIRCTADGRPHSHDMALIGEVATRVLDKAQNFKCLNCGEKCYPK